MRRPADRVAGFSLLEAMIALAIAAVCLVPIFELQHQLVDGQRRHEAALQQAQLMRNVLVLLRDINPTETPEGSATLDPDLTIAWTSEAIGDPKVNSGFPTAGRGGANNQGSYTIQLYRIDAQVLRGQTEVIPAFSVERLGWEKPEVAAAPAATPGGGRGGGGRG